MNATYCWGCHVKPSAGVRFQRCSLCVERNLTPTAFCSRECLALHWPRHKAWHKEQRKNIQTIEPEITTQDREVAETVHAYATERPNDVWATNLAAAEQNMADGNYRKAARHYRRAIALKPTRPCGWFNLGMTYFRSNQIVQAVHPFLRSSELFERGSADWAEAVAHVFHCRYRVSVQTPSALPEAATPSWWTDVELKVVSKEVVDNAAHDDDISLLMRANVLSSPMIYQHHVSWDDSTTAINNRTSTELREAACCFQSAARISPAFQEGYIRASTSCLAMAAAMDGTMCGPQRAPNSSSGGAPSYETNGIVPASNLAHGQVADFAAKLLLWMILAHNYVADLAALMRRNCRILIAIPACCVAVRLASLYSV